MQRSLIAGIYLNILVERFATNYIRIIPFKNIYRIQQSFRNNDIQPTQTLYPVWPSNAAAKMSIFRPLIDSMTSEAIWIYFWQIQITKKNPFQCNLQTGLQLDSSYSMYHRYKMRFNYQHDCLSKLNPDFPLLYFLEFNLNKCIWMGIQLDKCFHVYQHDSLSSFNADFPLLCFFAFHCNTCISMGIYLLVLCSSNYL